MKKKPIPSDPKRSDAPRPSGLDTDLLTADGVAWIQGHRLLLVATTWLLTRGFALWGLKPNADVMRYFEVASRWLEGATPYADYVVEYPPGALLLFALPRLVTSTPVTYGYAFAALMVIVDLLIIATLWRIPALAFGRRVNWKNARRYESAMICLTYLILTGVFSRMPFQRFDLLVALLIAGILYGALRGWRWYWVDGLVAVGIWLKLYPVALLPLLWVHGCIVQRHSTTQPPMPWTKCLRYFTTRGGVVVAATALLFAPFVAMAGPHLFSFLGYHAVRGLQVESSAASVLVVLAQVFSLDLSVEFTQGAFHLEGPLSDLGARFSAILGPLCFAAVTARFGLWMRRQRVASDLNLLLLRGLLAATLTLIVTSKVFSPQYLLWVAPLACLLVSDLRHGLRPLGMHAFLINLLSAILLRGYYRDLLNLDLIPTLILFFRNLLTAWLIFELCFDSPQLRQPIRMVPGHWRERITGAMRRAMPTLSLSLLTAWVATAAFAPTTTNDLWLHLRVGRDILSTGEFPYREVYSAVAEGRPFIAHEWLSAVCFHLLAHWGAGYALTLFKSAMTTAILAALWFSVAPARRRFILTAPLLALASYLVLERAFVRPHIFTLLFIAVWMLVFERWRQDRNWRILLILPLMQIPWANLHGAYIFGVILCATATVGATATAILGPRVADEQFSWKEARLLGAITLCCLLACLLNPYGVDLLGFSLKMGGDSDFIRASIYEWKTPFQVPTGYTIILAGCMILIVWGGLLARVTRLPVLDLCFALLGTYMFTNAIRFIPYVGIIGLPIAIRHWMAIADHGVKESVGKPHRVIEASAFALLLATTIAYGYGFRPTSHREIGWGFSGRMPYAEVIQLRRLGVSGVIYNEYSDGAFIIHALYPKVRPVMDSRIDIYGPELWREYTSSQEGPEEFLSYVKKYDITLVMLLKIEKNLAMAEFIQDLPGTETVLQTEDRIVYRLPRSARDVDLEKKLSPPTSPPQQSPILDMDSPPEAPPHRRVRP